MAALRLCSCAQIASAYAIRAHEQEKAEASTRRGIYQQNWPPQKPVLEGHLTGIQFFAFSLCGAALTRG
jgi:hypothetical protein